MLSDRPYMRDDYQQERTSALIWLVSALVASFVLQLLMGGSWIRGGSHFDEVLGLTVNGLRSGWGWTLLTHAFLHSPEFLGHVIFNVVALYFLGRELVPMLGPRRFLGLFAAATIVSGATWSAVHWGDNEMHLGSTAAIEALFIVFACFFPNQQTSFLVLFFPVTLKPKHIAFAIVGINLIGLFCYELPHNTLPFELTLASSAHLAAVFTGYVYYRFVHDGRWLSSPDRAEVELPRWLKRVKRHAPQVSAVEAEAPAPMTREAVRAEVDRILDKINSEGLAALSPEEKRLLDEAKQLLSRH